MHQSAKNACFKHYFYVFRNYIPYIICVLFLACNTFKKEEGCKRFKEGRFYVRYKNYNRLPAFYISRNDELQTEINLSNGCVTTFRIMWQADCSYTITPVSTTDIQFDTDEFKKGHPINVDIISWTDSTYVFHARHKGGSNDVIDTIWIKPD